MTTLVDVISYLNKEGFSEYINNERRKCQLNTKDMEDFCKADYAFHAAQSAVLNFLIEKRYLNI